MAQQLLVDQVLFITEASRSYSDTPHSVGLLCSSDQPDAETSIGRHTTITRDRYPCPQWDSNPQSQLRATDDPSLRPRGYWDQPNIPIASFNKPYNCYSYGLGEGRSVWFPIRTTEISKSWRPVLGPTQPPEILSAGVKQLQLTWNRCWDSECVELYLMPPYFSNRGA